MKKRIDFMTAWLSVVILICLGSVVAWELVNWATTYEPLVTLMGKSVYITILSLIFIAVDAVFLIQIILKSFVLKNKNQSAFDAFWNDPVSRGIAGGWVLVTLFDTVLTWFWFAQKMEMSVGTSVQAPALIRPYLMAFPFILAILSWVLQGALIVTAARSLQQLSDSFAQRNTKTRYAPQRPQSVDGSNERQAEFPVRRPQ